MTDIEKAFKAAYDCAAKRAVAFHPTKITDWEAAKHQAWVNYKNSML